MRSTSDPNDEDGRLHSRGRENCSRAASLKMLDQSEKSAQCWGAHHGFGDNVLCGDDFAGRSHPHRGADVGKGESSIR